MTPTHWIIRNDQPFQGWTQSYLNKNGKVAYQDEELTFEDYNEKNGGAMMLITDKELTILLEKHLKDMQGPWTEITEEDYYDQYECLPPIYRGHFWFSMEPTTGSLHQCYIKANNKYYTALRDVYSKPEDLDKDFRSATPKTLELDEEG